MGGPASRSTDLEVTVLRPRPDGAGSRTARGARTFIPAKAMTCLNKGGVDWDGSAAQESRPRRGGQGPGPLVRRPGAAGTPGPGSYKGTVDGRPRGPAGDDPRRRARGHRRGPRRRRRRRSLPHDPAALARFDAGPGRRRRPALSRRSRSTSSRSAASGRSLAIGRDGFPARIQSYFAPEMTRSASQARRRDGRPRSGSGSSASDGNEHVWTPSVTGPRVGRRGPGAVVWEADNCNGDFLMRLEARMEFDGFVEYKVAVYRPAAMRRRRRHPARGALEPGGRRRYMMGLGLQGRHAAGERSTGPGTSRRTRTRCGSATSTPGCSSR
ncbi:MAG: DUF6067 family protein [Sphingobacterium sp.]|nr:DUF6067 family protein [Sphingobacterium sp.]